MGASRQPLPNHEHLHASSFRDYRCTGKILVARMQHVDNGKGSMSTNNKLGMMDRYWKS